MRDYERINMCDAFVCMFILDGIYGAQRGDTFSKGRPYVYSRCDDSVVDPVYDFWIITKRKFQKEVVSDE